MKFLSKNVIILEIILVIGFIVSLFLKQYWGVTVSLALLAILYFILGLRESIETENTMVVVLTKIFWIGDAVVVVGALFQLIDLPGSHNLLIVGLVTLVVLVFASMFTILANSENAAFLKVKIVRGMALALVAAVLLLFPGINIIDQVTT